MFVSVRDEKGDVVKHVDTEKEAKELVKVNKGWSYRIIGKIWA